MQRASVESEVALSSTKGKRDLRQARRNVECWKVIIFVGLLVSGSAFVIDIVQMQMQMQMQTQKQTRPSPTLIHSTLCERTRLTS